MGAVITNFPTISPVNQETDFSNLYPSGFFAKITTYSNVTTSTEHVISNYNNKDIRGFLLNNPNLFKPYGGSQVTYVMAGICLLSNSEFTVLLEIGEHRVNSFSYTYSYYPSFNSGIITFQNKNYHGSIISTGHNEASSASAEYTGIYAVDKFDSFEEGLIATGVSPINDTLYPITYRPTNCSFPGAPAEAAVGETVVVPVTFPDGYGLVNESNIYVTNNGVVIPSTYSNGQLTFTMPDPS